MGDHPRLGTKPTDREIQLFHAWLSGGSSAAAAQLMGCGAQNVSLALARLEDRLGVDRAPQLVRPLIMTPMYGRIRRIERQNRELRAMIRVVLMTYEPESTRQLDGGIGTKRHRKRWRKARAAAVAAGYLR